MERPEFWIVAGPNGAGKTTCVQKEPISELLPHVTFFNPDDRTLTRLRASGYPGFPDAPIDVQTQSFIESANEIFAELQEAITRNEAVGVETVLSSDKYRGLVKATKDRHGFVGLIYVSLSSPAIAQERVAARVRGGGHGVSDEKIAARWKRSLENLAWFAAEASAFWVVDNSDSNPENPPILIATGKSGIFDYLNDETFPEMKAALANVPSR